jgi:hypothetical protein
MSVDKPRNELSTPLTKFCLALEEHRRTPEGRVRTSSEFLHHFFPFNDGGSSDLVFRYLPREVRGPVLAGWQIRGLKAALRDPDEKVESVVYDALIAGDIDADGFERGLTSEIVVQWVPLVSWWTLWRGGKLSKKALLKAFEAAFSLGLFDAKWFLGTIESRGGKLRGTEVIAEGLTKADLTEWVRRIHESGNGTAAGLLSAVGWEKIVTQTPNDVLLAALDAFALKCGLAIATTPSTADVPADAYATSTGSVPPQPAAPGTGSRSGAPPARSVPPMRSRRPEPALLHEERMIAAVEDEVRATDASSPPPIPAQIVVDELDFGSQPPSQPPSKPPNADEDPPSGSLRDRIDFIRRRIP